MLVLNIVGFRLDVCFLALVGCFAFGLTFAEHWDVIRQVQCLCFGFVLLLLDLLTLCVGWVSDFWWTWVFGLLVYGLLYLLLGVSFGFCAFRCW